MLRVEPKDDEPDHGPETPQAGGALAELLAVYDAIDTGRNQTETFDIPGTNVAVRYHRLSQEDTLKAVTSEGSEWERNAQFLIDACQEILYRNPAGDLEPVKPGVKTTFAWTPESTPLHTVLGRDDITDIRQSVLRLFQGAERVLILHAGQVDAWMDRLHAETEEKFSGG